MDKTLDTIGYCFMHDIMAYASLASKGLLRPSSKKRNRNERIKESIGERETQRGLFALSQHRSQAQRSPQPNGG